MGNLYHLNYNYDKDNAACNAMFNSLYYGGLTFNYNNNGQVKQSRIETIGILSKNDNKMRDLVSGNIVIESKNGFVPGLSYRSKILIEEEDYARLANILSKINDKEILTYIKYMQKLEYFMNLRYKQYTNDINTINQFANKCRILRK